VAWNEGAGLNPEAGEGFKKEGFPDEAFRFSSAEREGSRRESREDGSKERFWGGFGAVLGQEWREVRFLVEKSSQTP
jgi:hypothetical protein